MSRLVKYTADAFWLCFVSLLWGATNPLIRKGSQGIEEINRSSRIKQFCAEVIFLASNWKVTMFPKNQRWIVSVSKGVFQKSKTNVDLDPYGSSNCWCLRNRKHFPCSYQVIETRVEVWENEKCCGYTSRRWVFPQFFSSSPKLSRVFLQLNRNTKKMFSISFRKYLTTKNCDKIFLKNILRLKIAKKRWRFDVSKC